ncbi:MAG: YdcF family protein, partial [Alphaproteobacteria bacterium]
MVTGLLAIAWLVGLAIFMASVPREPSTTFTRADGIVVLTGGDYRLAEAMRLLSDRRGQRLLISGVNANTSRSDVLDRFGADRAERLECCVDLDRAAMDTRGNAEETGRWARAHGFGSLIVVTANYHMPRSLMEMRRSLPGVTLIPHPVFPPGCGPTTRWEWSVAGRLIVGEYLKFCASLLLP